MILGTCRDVKEIYLTGLHWKSHRKGLQIRGLGVRIPPGLPGNGKGIAGSLQSLCFFGVRTVRDSPHGVRPCAPPNLILQIICPNLTVYLRNSAGKFALPRHGNSPPVLLGQAWRGSIWRDVMSARGEERQPNSAGLREKGPENPPMQSDQIIGPPICFNLRSA